jgi:hypothetical protein
MKRLSVRIEKKECMGPISLILDGWSSKTNSRGGARVRGFCGCYHIMGLEDDTTAAPHPKTPLRS